MGDDPAGYVDALVERVLPLAAAAGDPLIRTFAGGMRFAQYLPTRTFELVVHGLDIAGALRSPAPAYSRAVLDEVVTLAGSAAVVEEQGRAGAARLDRPRRTAVGLFRRLRAFPAALEWSAAQAEKGGTRWRRRMI